jgi:hypothetical protein
MQLYALDQDEMPTVAMRASKGLDYTCLECGDKVRLRGGSKRQAHFYHVSPNGLCRSSGKTKAHLDAQNYLLSILPGAEMECRFKEIGRIADIAWHPEKIIYEIQCSPITAEEVAQRNSSYQSIGYQVIWIFHDLRYNQDNVTAAEYVLRSLPHYFMDLTKGEEPEIYDQLAVISRGWRQKRFDRLLVDPKSVIRAKDPSKSPIPLIRATKIYLAGGYNDLALKGDVRVMSAIAKFMETHREGDEEPLLCYLQRLFSRRIALPIKAIFRILLERACR